ncbi:hypothetical protein AALA79_12660 [Lachnospiraceae bacterium 64-25]
MATDEEYLDSLLKSMTDNESNRSMEEVMREVSKTPKEDDISFGVEDFFESSPELSEDILENISLLDDSAITADSDSADGVGELLEQDEWKLSLDDILAQAETQSGEAEADGFFDAPDWGDGEPSIDIPDIPEIPDVSETAQEADPVNAENMDVTDLIDGMDNTDVDLAEINGLLKSADSKESANDDMLALLEGVDVDQMDAFSDPDADSEFSIFSESDLEKSASYGSGSLDQTDKKKEKKAKKEKKKKEKKSRLFGKKKKETGADFDEQMEDTAQDGLSLDGLLDSAENGEGSDGDGEKKLGLFSRVINYLMEEEEEEASDETQEAADGTGEAADKKASKKDKKKKSKKGKKGKEQEADSDEEIDEEEDSSKSKKKPKKEKKEKKEKPPKEKVKTERVLSTKKLLVLIAFCATITASIVVFSTFLPEYADKKNANEAFYKGDYETVYKLLYNKQLNSSDSIIFNRARIVLKLERKLQSYENNMTLNRQVEAVDALMQGVKCYHELTGADTYGASDELNALYQQICVILQNNYGISPEEAVEINAYDNVSYTTKLNSIVSGTAFSIPEETAAESE